MSASLILDVTGERLPIQGAIAVNLQDNDILKPASVQAPFSTPLTLADAGAIHRALGHAAVGTSATTMPYTEIPATLEQDGVELLPRGRAVLEKHESGKGYSGRVYGGNKDFFAAIDGKKLRELDLTRYAHTWTLDNVAAGAQHTGWRQGYVYDLYDTGKSAPVAGESVDIYEAELFPSVYVRAVWEQLFADAGRSWVGTLPAHFDALLLPTVDPSGYGEDFRTARRLLAGIGRNVEDSGGRSANRGTVVRPVPYTDVTASSGYVAPMVAGIYDATELGPADRPAPSWTAETICYVDVKATAVVEFDVQYGKASAELLLYKNGQQFGNGGGKVEATPAKGLVSTSLTVPMLLVQPGDKLQVYIRLKGEGGALGERWAFRMFRYATFTDDGQPLPVDSWSITVAENFPPGGLVRPQDWLPDMPQATFVKAVIGLYGLTMQTDPYSGALRFTPTATALTRLAEAPTWDARIDRSQPVTANWHLDGICRGNFFRWQDDATNPEQARRGDAQPLGLGDGVLSCSDATLDKEQDWLTLPFAATAPGRNDLLLLPRYKLTIDPTIIDQTYQRQTPQPRLVQQTTRTRSVDLVVHTPRADGQGTEVLPANRRAGVVMRLASFVEAAGPDLDFARTLLPAYYPHLSSVLRRPLQVRPFVRLTAADVAGYDQLLPVWLEEYGAFFWSNRIEGYRPDAPAVAVILLRMNP